MSTSATALSSGNLPASFMGTSATTLSIGNPPANIVVMSPTTLSIGNHSASVMGLVLCLLQLSLLETTTFQLASWVLLLLQLVAVWTLHCGQIHVCIHIGALVFV